VSRPPGPHENSQYRFTTGFRTSSGTVSRAVQDAVSKAFQELVSGLFQKLFLILIQELVSKPDSRTDSKSVILKADLPRRARCPKISHPGGGID
jgi:hypothetical protein